MEIYDYLQAVTDDVIDYMKENNIDPYTVDLDDLIDDAFIDDDITGYGSGSYTFDKIQAAQNLVGNWDLLRDCTANYPDFDPLKAGPEACDIAIRRGVLGRAAKDAIEIMKKREQ